MRVTEAEVWNSSEGTPERLQFPKVTLPPLKEYICNYKVIESQVERLIDKCRTNPHRKYTQVYGVPLNKFLEDKKKFISAIEQELRKNFKDPISAEIVEVSSNQKKRRLYKFPLTQQIANSALTELLNKMLGSLWHANLYSYRKGYSAQEARRKLCELVRKSRDRHIICVDIESYSDSIPVGASSYLYKSFRNHCEFSSEEDFEYLKNHIRPLLYMASSQDIHFENIIGVPTGTPLSCFIFNFYIYDLDHYLTAKYPDLFYMRYGDDLILSHESPDTLLMAYDDIKIFLKERGLSLKKSKEQFICLNGSGANSLVSKPYSSAQFLEYLGYSFNNKGNLFPDRDKHRTFLRELNLLVINARTIARELSWQPKELVQYISSCIKKRMNPEDFQFNFSFSAHFKYVDSRNYFKEIDYLLSLKVAETLSGVKGVRAFRENSASKLYALGLYSFERSKNKECC